MKNLKLELTYREVRLLYRLLKDVNNCALTDKVEKLYEDFIKQIK